MFSRNKLTVFDVRNALEIWRNLNRIAPCNFLGYIQLADRRYPLFEFVDNPGPAGQTRPKSRAA